MINTMSYRDLFIWSCICMFAFTVLTLCPFQAGAVYKIGKHEFIVGRSSGVLEKKQTLGWANSGPFLGGVGGVSFYAKATPADGNIGKEIILNYNPLRSDGSRLEIFLGDTLFLADIPDWMLIPIAKYADSDFNACVSLFGRNSTFGKHDIVYHPAFENTLLGLRLLQADALLIEPKEFCNSPKLNDTLILGTGEKSVDQNPSQSFIQEIDSILVFANCQSWVIVDDSLKITFDTSQGKLIISNVPFYYFWHQEKDQFVNSFKATNWAMEKNEMISNLNPNVAAALKSTMQFSAFFRFIKANHPNEWMKFLSQIEHTNIYPNIKTPTEWRPDRKFRQHSKVEI